MAANVRTLTCALLLAATTSVHADDITGRYEMVGQLKAGDRYAGEVRLDRDGEDFVLSTRFEDGAARPQARGSATPRPDGCWLLTFPVDPATRGTSSMADRLEGLLEENGGRARAEETTAPKKLYVKKGRDGKLLAYIYQGGQKLAREKWEPRTSAELTVVAFAPEQRRFTPHHAMNNTIEMRYRLEPATATADVSVQVADRDGTVVYTERREAVPAGAQTFTWDGELDGASGFADCRRSPYRITVTATQGDATASSDPVAIVAVPLVDACYVVSREGDSGLLTSDNKIIAHDAKPVIAGVVRAIVAGVRAADRGRTTRAYFLTDDPLPATQARIAHVGTVTLQPWDARMWSPLEVKWQSIVALGLHSPVYRETQNARRSTRDGEFTNVVSNGEREGTWVGRDVTEYRHDEVGTGPSPNADTEPGTLRYRVSANYRAASLRLSDDEAPGSLGRRSTSETTATRAYSGLTHAAYSAQLGGASASIHRISRRGPSENALLSYLECYRRVPWIYGSLGNQVEEFIGYDCADLVLGAARKAGLSRTRYTNANNLCRAYTKAVASSPTLKWVDGRTVDARTGEDFPIACGQGASGAQPGDVLFFDWDGDGKWDHTTVLWDCRGADRLTPDASLVWAHHDSTSTDGFYIAPMRRLSLGEPVRMKIRRFSGR